MPGIGTVLFHSNAHFCNPFQDRSGIFGSKLIEQYFKIFGRLRPSSARDRISRNRESTLTLSFLDPNEHDSLNILSPVRVIS